MMALDFETQAQQMKRIAGQTDFAVGSVHTVTRRGRIHVILIRQSVGF